MDKKEEIIRRELIEKIAGWTKDEGPLKTKIPALKLVKRSAPTEATSYLHEPSICIISQGAKRVILGEEVYVYDEHHFLINSVNLPVISQVTHAGKEKPYLGLVLEFKREDIMQMVTDGYLPSPSRARKVSKGMAVGKIFLPLLEAILRLINLLDTPEDIPMLAPLIKREILYRLLTGEQGLRLLQVAASGSNSEQIAKAVDWLKTNFSKPLKVDDLATHSGMSTSSFHQHFRSLTAMTPLQYQKRLRLNEARQLMFMQRLDAGTASFQVGYESQSQFSREYSRLFGAPPSRDIKNLLEMVPSQDTFRHQEAR
jgi:AraC-like DNA-binding protein